MESPILKIVQGLEALELSRYPIAEFATWMNAESTDMMTMLPSESVEDTDVSNVMWEISNAIDACLQNEECRDGLWDALTAMMPQANRAISMAIQYYITKYTASAPRPHFDSTSSQAAYAACLYYSLLRVPGAKAHGLYDQSLLRRCIMMSKRMLEIAALAMSADDEKIAKPRRARKEAARQAQPSGSRRNPRRGASTAEADGDLDMESTSMPAAAEDEVIDDDGDADDGEYDGERKPAARASRGRAAATASNNFTLNRTTITMLQSLMFYTAALTHDFSFAAQPEMLPMVIDVALVTLQLPEHVANVAGERQFPQINKSFGKVTISSALLDMASMLLLNVVSNTHGSPLTAARLVCKKLKPLLLQGTATASSIALSFGVSGDDDDAPLAEMGGFALPQLAKPLDPRIVRGRAVHFIQVLVVNAVDGTSHMESGSPIASDVLCRLPAIAALLQHICVSCVSAKADVRAHCTEVVAHVRGTLPHSLRRAFVRFLTKFGRSSKVQYRQFAVELAARLLGSATSTSSGVTFADGAKDTKELIELIYSECPVPSANEKAEESAGYTEEVLSYTTTDVVADDADEELSNSFSPMPSRKKSRASICMLTATGPGTPARTVSCALPGTGAKSHKSPFYRTGSLSTGKHRRSSTGSQSSSPYSFTSDTDGCADARPTAMILLDYLVHRMSDKAPAVRTRALGLMTDLMSISTHSLARSNAAICTFVMKALMSGSGNIASEVTLADTTVATTPAHSSHRSESDASEVFTASSTICSPLVPLFLRRMDEDARPACKKAALAALAALGQSAVSEVVICPRLTSYMRSGGAATAAELSYERAVMLFQQVFEKCMQIGASGIPAAPSISLGLFAMESIAAKGADTSVLVRKAALAAMQALIQCEPDCSAIQQLWLATAFPMVYDAEPTVLAKVIENTAETLLTPLSNWLAAWKDKQISPCGYVWQMLDVIAASDDLKSCLNQICFLLIRAHVSMPKTDAFSPKSLIPLLKLVAAGLPAEHEESSVGTRLSLVRRGTWMLLSCFAQQLFSHRSVASLAAVDCGNKYLQLTKRMFLDLTAATVSAWKEFSDELEHAGSASMVANVTLNDTTSSIALHFPAEQIDDINITDDCVNCLKTLALICTDSKHSDLVAPTLEGLTAGICTFSWNPALTSAAIQACVSIVECEEAGRTKFATWGKYVLGACEASLLRYVACKQQSDLDKYALAAANVLFVLGECAAIGLDTTSGQGVQEKGAVGAVAGKPKSLEVCQQLFTLVQALVAPSMSGYDDDASAGVVHIPEQVRAHAYVALGKLCLRDSTLARRYITVFIRDLAAPSSPMSVRNNILFVLGDLCVRYTALVDRYVPHLAACIVDPHPTIRRHAVVLLTQLIVEEYVKFRGPLFYRLATALSDSDEGVRRCAESAVTGTLMSKFRSTIAAHFVGLIFVSTGCAHLPAYRHLVSGFDPETDASAEAGSTRYMDYAIPSTLRRSHIYRALLRAMPDDQKLAVYGKLGSDILANVTEGQLHLNPASQTARSYEDAELPYALGSTELLVTDTLQLLCSTEMRSATATKAAASKAEVAEDPEANFAEMDDAPAAASAAATAAKQKILGKIVRKHVVENILPICLGLRHFLASARSSLMHHLLGFVKVLSEDFTEDFKDALASDRHTAAELEFDLRMYVQQQQSHQAAAQSTPAARRAIIRSHSDTTAATPSRSGVRFTDAAPASASASACRSVCRVGNSGVSITSPKLKRSASEAMVARTPTASKLAPANPGNDDKTGGMLLSPHPEDAKAAIARDEAWNVVVPSAVSARDDISDNDENYAPPPAKTARTTSRRRAARS